MTNTRRDSDHCKEMTEFRVGNETEGYNVKKPRFPIADNIIVLFSFKIPSLALLLQDSPWHYKAPINDVMNTDRQNISKSGQTNKKNAYPVHFNSLKVAIIK